MKQPHVSVVIVSRHRPEALILCLRAVARLDYASYEVVVVADRAGLAAVARSPFADKIKTVAFDEANISAARNRGIAVAAGTIIAFLDDDAIPEPRWLSHLIAPFVDRKIAATGGFVRGRNGISFQWKGRITDLTGQSYPVDVHPTVPTALTPPAGWAIKTEGTNMAVRRGVLAGLGGFDPAFQFFLDETDLNVRLAHAGHATAIVPLAQVHHGFSASATRRQDRAVRDLFQIAASTMVFLRKHCPEHRHQTVLAAAFAEQRKRLDAQLTSGLQEPRDVRYLLRSWRKGVEDGQARRLTDSLPLPPAHQAFLPYLPRLQNQSLVLSGHWSKARSLRIKAAKAAKEGALVSLFLFSYSHAFHRVMFRSAGYWEQTGGLWGRSDRDKRPIRVWSMQERVAHEMDRVGAARYGKKEV